MSESLTDLGIDLAEWQDPDGWGAPVDRAGRGLAWLLTYGQRIDADVRRIDAGRMLNWHGRRCPLAMATGRDWLQAMRDIFGPAFYGSADEFRARNWARAHGFLGASGDHLHFGDSERLDRAWQMVLANLSTTVASD